MNTLQERRQQQIFRSQVTGVKVRANAAPHPTDEITRMAG